MWNGINGTPTTATTTDAIWSGWVTAGTGTGTGTVSVITWGQWATQVHETQEQRRAREERDVKMRAELAAQEKRRVHAKLRARKLLVDHLDAEQRKSYEEKGHFYLLTRSGKKYRIDQGTHGNVKLVDVTKNSLLGSYCIQPSGVPDEDAMLAQKLHLEMNEEEFLRVANFRPLSATG